MLQVVSVALFHDHGEETQVLLIRRGPGTVLEGTLAFPGGRVEDGEALLAAAVRELQEETDLQIDPGLLDSGESLQLEGFVPVPLHLTVYRGRLGASERSPPKVQAGSDASEARWYRVSELLQAWSRGELPLTDSVRWVLERVFGPTAEATAPQATAPQANRCELRRGVTLLALPSQTLPPATHTNAYLLGTGEERILVDPGAETEEDARPLLLALEALAAKGIRLREIWLTHHHRDHHASLPLIRARNPTRPLPCRAHPLTAQALPEGTVNAPFRDGEETRLPGPVPQTWAMLEAPGHTADHAVFLERGQGTLLCGDHIAGVGTVIVDPPDGDMAAYLKTLDRLGTLEASLLLPGHGPPTTLVAERIATYRAHRLAREAAILQAVLAGASRLETVVQEVYTDVPTYLHPFAERSALAHLLKLEAEGRAKQEDGQWRPAPKDFARG